MRENKAKFEELGLGKYVTLVNPPTGEKNKEKEQVQQESDEYILENESEVDSDDSSKVHCTSYSVIIVGLYFGIYVALLMPTKSCN